MPELSGAYFSTVDTFISLIMERILGKFADIVLKMMEEIYLLKYQQLGAWRDGSAVMDVD